MKKTSVIIGCLSNYEIRCICDDSNALITCYFDKKTGIDRFKIKLESLLDIVNNEPNKIITFIVKGEILFDERKNILTKFFNDCLLCNPDKYFNLIIIN
jgi:hypothetical protein